MVSALRPKVTETAVTTPRQNIFCELARLGAETADAPRQSKTRICRPGGARARGGGPGPTVLESGWVGAYVGRRAGSQIDDTGKACW